MKLSPEFYAEKAKIELNETETRKEQSLRQLRERFSKHPFIKSNKSLDEMFLLAALRTTKFSIDKAQERIEKSIIAVKTTPEYRLPMEKLLNPLNNVFVAKERDANGCRILYVDVGRINPQDFNPHEFLFNAFSTFVVVSVEHETQISGIRGIVDMRKVSTMHVKKLFDLNIANIISHTNSLCMRIKELTFVGLPPYAVALSELILRFLSDKLKQRVRFVNHLDCEYMDDDLEDVRMKLIELSNQGSLLDVDVDMEAIKNYSGIETYGSFRKLEID